MFNQLPYEDVRNTPMDGLQILKNERFGEIRVAGTSDEPLFCLADVFKILDLQITPTKNRLKQDGVSLIKVIDSPGRTQEAIFVSKSCLYKAIMRSDKPQAEPFQDRVCGEILPSIRKHGIYTTDNVIDQILNNPDFGIELLTKLKEERSARIKAEQKVAEAVPAVANAVQSANNSCLVGELAKLIAPNGYPIGEKRLFAWMRENGYPGKHGERYNIPNQQYVEQGLFELKKGVRSSNGSVLHTTITTKVTGKGQVYFVNKFLPA